MNRNQIILIVVPFLLIFGYQNCQKSSFDPAAMNLKNPSESVSNPDEQIIVLANESLQGLQFRASEVSQVPHGSTSVSVVKNLSYNFDLASGEFHVIDQRAQSDSKYCLPESLKSQVNSLLSAASVCTITRQLPEGTVCGQVYDYGYATLVTNRDEFHFGAAKDSCRAVEVDLCEGSTELKAWFAGVQSSISSLSCSN